MKKINLKVFSWGYANEDTGWGMIGWTQVMAQNRKGIYRVIPFDYSIFDESAAEYIKKYLGQLAQGEKFNYRVDESSISDLEWECNRAYIPDGAGNGESCSNSFDTSIEVTEEEEDALLKLLDF